MQTEARRAGSKEKTRGGEEDRPGLQERPEHLQCLDAESKETGGKPRICTTANSRCQSWVTTEMCLCILNRIRCQSWVTTNMCVYVEQNEMSELGNNRSMPVYMLKE